MMRRSIKHAFIAAGVSLALAGLATAQTPCESHVIEGPKGFGFGRAMNADWLAIRRQNSGNGSLYVYERSDGEPMFHLLLQSFTPPTNAFGRPALFGHTLVVTDEMFPTDQPSAGAAFVYRYKHEQWVLEATLTAQTNPPPVSSLFGRSHAIDGDVVLVGAPRQNINGVLRAGAAFVFREQPGGWNVETMLTAPLDTIDSDDVFGSAVSLKNGIALIGAHGHNGPGNLTGGAFVFREDDGQWHFEQMLKPPDTSTAQKWFGAAVALDDAAKVAVVGAPQEGSQNGAVYVFRHNGENYVFEKKLTAANPVGLAPHLGGGVAVSGCGNVIFAAAHGDSEAGWEAGALHVFRYDGSQWNEIVKMTSSQPEGGTQFGSVSIWGDDAAVSQAANAPTGKVFLFTGILGHDCNDSGQPDACDIFYGDSTDTSGDGMPDECAADLNGDGKVGVPDLLILLSQWGLCNLCDDCPADLTGDCAVGVPDLLVLLQNWG